MAATGETEGNKIVTEWSRTRGQRPMSLSARPHEQPSVGGTMGVLLSCQRHPEVWASLGVKPAGVGMREMACTKSWSRTAASEAHMSNCQQLERLGLDRVCEPSCWILYTSVHIYTPTVGHLSCSARGGRRMRLLLLCLCNWWVCE